MDAKDLNLLGIISLVGAALIIIGVFMNWLATDLLDYTITGWNLYTDWTDVTKYAYLPLADLIFGIVVIALMIIPVFCNIDRFKRINNILGILTVILSIAILVVSLMFITKEIDFYLFTIHISNHLKIGFWMTIIGIALTIVGGFMPLVKNRLEITVKAKEE